MPRFRSRDTLGKPLATIHVTVELAGSLPSGPSLEALGVGRRLASYLGASVVAVVMRGIAPLAQNDDVLDLLGAHGADRVIFVCGDGLDSPL